MGEGVVELKHARGNAGHARSVAQGALMLPNTRAVDLKHKVP